MVQDIFLESGLLEALGSPKPAEHRQSEERAAAPPEREASLLLD